MVAQLDPFNPNNNTFGTRERVFTFGTVVATLAEPGAAAAAPPPGAAEAARSPDAKLDATAVVGGGTGKLPGGKAGGGGAKGRASSVVDAAGKAAAEALVVQPVGPSDWELGVKAGLKIINPTKVPCTVNFSLKPRGTCPPGKGVPCSMHRLGKGRTASFGCTFFVHRPESLASRIGSAAA